MSKCQAITFNYKTDKYSYTPKIIIFKCIKILWNIFYVWKFIENNKNRSGEIRLAGSLSKLVQRLGCFNWYYRQWWGTVALRSRLVSYQVVGTIQFFPFVFGLNRRWQPSKNGFVQKKREHDSPSLWCLRLRSSSATLPKPDCRKVLLNGGLV